MISRAIFIADANRDHESDVHISIRSSYSIQYAVLIPLNFPYWINTYDRTGLFVIYDHITKPFQFSKARVVYIYFSFVNSHRQVNINKRNPC